MNTFVIDAELRSPSYEGRNVSFIDRKDDVVEAVKFFNESNRHNFSIEIINIERQKITLNFSSPEEYKPNNLTIFSRYLYHKKNWKVFSGKESVLFSLVLASSNQPPETIPIPETLNAEPPVAARPVNAMRCLSAFFMDSLKSGVLGPILERVKNDDTLMLAIRKGYVNIYYRGGNILKIIEKGFGFDTFFDIKYDLSPDRSKFKDLKLPASINNVDDTNKWVSSVPVLKEIMDFWFSKNLRLEREFQQLVERENNRSSISGETEYFINDIEFYDPGITAKFDILAIKWLASDRSKCANCKAALIEMKYGDNAIDGTAGIIDHLNKLEAFLKEPKNISSLYETMECQFNQLDELGLLDFNHSSKGLKMKLNVSDKPEVIILLANHNPRSTKLESILKNPDLIRHATSQYFDLRFFAGRFAGYAMHSDDVLTYAEFLKLL